MTRGGDPSAGRGLAGAVDAERGRWPRGACWTGRGVLPETRRLPGRRTRDTEKQGPPSVQRRR
jgi:hypothetical protein